MKKILDERLAYCLSTKYGVMIAIMQFQNQLDEVERPTPRDLIGSGKISPITTHAQGPQVEANIEMLMQMKAIMEATAL